MAEMRCPECGNIVEDSWAFCKNCGCPKSFFEKIVRNVKCPECGYMVLSNQDCCPNCGCPIDYILKDYNEGSSIADKKRIVMGKRKARVEKGHAHDVGIWQDIEDMESDYLKKLASGELKVAIEEYKTNNSPLITKVAGVTFENRQSKIINLIKDGILFIGAKLYLRTEPTNIYDKYAVQVLSSNKVQIGYLSKEINRDFCIKIQSGTIFDVSVEEITGGSANYSYGITIKVIEL